MRKRRSFQKVVETFLADFTSRRSEYHRYWLFGFLFDAEPHLQIDLLGGETRGRGPIDLARRRAVYVFYDRLVAAQVQPSDVARACLTITRDVGSVDQVAGGVLRRGRQMIFRIVCVYDGALHHAECTRFVAPHDAALEHVSEPPFDEGEGRDT
jgi:hypothetical protein